LGKYQDKTGQSSCKQCPEGLTSTNDRKGCRFCEIGRTYPFFGTGCYDICYGDCDYWKSINPNRNYQDNGFDTYKICLENVMNDTCFDCNSNLCKYNDIINGTVDLSDVSQLCARCSGSLMLNGQDFCTNKLFTWDANDAIPDCLECRNLPFQMCDYDFRQFNGFTDDFVKFARIGCVPFDRYINQTMSYGTCKDCFQLFGENACSSSQYIESCSSSNLVCASCYNNYSKNSQVFSVKSLHSDIPYLNKRQCQVKCLPGYTGYTQAPCDSTCSIQKVCIGPDDVRVNCIPPNDGYCKKCMNNDVDLTKAFSIRTITDKFNFLDFEEGASSFEHVLVTTLDQHMCLRGSDGNVLGSAGMISFSNGQFSKQFDCKWDNDQVAGTSPEVLQIIQNSFPLYPLENVMYDTGEWRIDTIAYGVKHVEPEMPNLGRNYLRAIVFDRDTFTLSRYFYVNQTFSLPHLLFWLRLEDARVDASVISIVPKMTATVCFDGNCLPPNDVFIEMGVWKFQTFQVPSSLEKGYHKFTMTFTKSTFNYMVIGLDDFVLTNNMYNLLFDQISFPPLDYTNSLFGSSLDYLNIFVPTYHMVATFRSTNNTSEEYMKIYTTITGVDSVERQFLLCQKRPLPGKQFYTCNIHILQTWESYNNPIFFQGPIDKETFLLSPMQYTCHFACNQKNAFFRGDECISCPITCTFGQQFQGCTDEGEAVCLDCTNTLPDNAKYIFGTCNYVCLDGYYLTSNQLCLPCLNTSCEVGYYRDQCRNITGSPCLSCTTLRSLDAISVGYEYYVTAGDPYDQNNCVTECEEGSFRDAAGNCAPCRTTAFRYWEVRLQQYQRTISCTRIQDASYLPCGLNYDLTHGQYTGYSKTIDGDCPVLCDVGYYASTVNTAYTIDNYESNRYRNNLTSVTRYFQRNVCLKCSRASEANGYYTEGCNFVCNTDYRLINDVCVYCPTLTCSSGQYQSACGVCSACDALSDPNRIFTGPGAFGDASSCPSACRSEYYNQFDFVYSCVPCASLTTDDCGPNQWLRGCATEHNRACVDCTSSCGYGYKKVRNCSSTQDILCDVCTNVLPEFSTFGEDCQVICGENYVYNGQRCVFCNLQQTCPVGFYSTYCSLENNYTGCQPCLGGKLDNNLSDTLSVKYLSSGKFEDPYSCSWTCADGYALRLLETSDKNFSSYCERQQTPPPQVDIAYSEFGVCDPGFFATPTGCIPCTVRKPLLHAYWTFRCNWVCESGRIPLVEQLTGNVACVSQDDFEKLISSNPSIRSFVSNPYIDRYHTDTQNKRPLLFGLGISFMVMLLIFCFCGCGLVFLRCRLKRN